MVVITDICTEIHIFSLADIRCWFGNNDKHSDEYKAGYIMYSYTSREGDGLTVSCDSSSITNSDCDSVDSGALQLVYGVASASETATGALSSSVSLSPHHL